MDEAALIIEKELKPILPPKPHCWCPAESQKRYSIPPPESKQLEEQAHIPLQYMTFVSEVDGVHIPRGYFAIRKEHSNANNATKPPRPDPAKARTKLSLKDYARRKEAPGSASPPKSRPAPDHSVENKQKEAVPTARKLSSAAVASDMDRSRDAKPGNTHHKMDPQRRRSPSPERKKRAIEADDAVRSVKRVKAGDSVPSATPSRPSKTESSSSQKSDRLGVLDRKPHKDKLSPNAAINGSNPKIKSETHGSSPRSSSQVNGTHKHGASKEHTPKKFEHGSSKSSTPVIPPLLSPLRLGLSEPTQNARPSPKKKPPEPSLPKSLPKKPPPPERETSPVPVPKKRKPISIPPLLSPTLPPIVMEELAKHEFNTKAKPEPSSQKSNRTPLSPPLSSQKTVPKTSSQESSITVDARPEKKQEKPGSFIVAMKYKKQMAKRIQLLLKLPPKGQKKQAGIKKEERSVRERSESLEPVTARKRPRTGADAHPSEASKRPRTSETLQPSTPLKQSSAMTRVASNSSIAGTPGASSNFTPVTQPTAEHRRADPEKVRRQMSQVNMFRSLGTKLKHERDAIMRPKDGEKLKVSERDRYEAIAAGVQSLLSYIFAFKLEMDARDMDKKGRPVACWREMQPLIRAIRSDCNMYGHFSALVFRIQGMCLVYHSKALCSHPGEPEAAKELMNVTKDQQDVWRAAEKARKSLGAYDGRSGSEDSGGPVGKLIDRLGPWSAPEEAIPIALEILRRTTNRYHDRWKPADDLAKVAPPAINGNA